MKRFRKFGVINMLAVAMVFIMTACQSSKAFTFNVSTGDSIRVELDTSDGYDLKQNDGRFEILSEEGETLVTGIFMTAEGTEMYREAAREQGTYIEESTINGNYCLTYTVEADDHTEYNCIIWVTDSNTGVIVASLSDRNTVDEIISLLTITSE